MSALSASLPPSHSVVRFHEGQALLRIAGIYPTIQTVLLEEVQNALDVGAKKILIDLDYQKRRLTIRDNGRGVNRVEFEAALRSVCLSVKDEGKLGRYGIGLVSPLGKCDSFTFTSCSASESSGFLRWTFNVKAISQQGSDLKIPCEFRPDLTLDEREARKKTPCSLADGSLLEQLYPRPFHQSGQH